MTGTKSSRSASVVCPPVAACHRAFQARLIEDIQHLRTGAALEPAMLDYPACAIRRGGVRLRGLKPALRQEAIICPLDVRRFHDLPLPVIPFPVAVENEHLARYDLPEECEWVFPGDAEGKPLQDIKRFWEDVRAKAELPAVRIHDLRHTFASLLVSGGMTLPMIGKLLGHTQVQTTQRYAHKLDDPLRAGLEQVGDMLRAKPKLVQNICS